MPPKLFGKVGNEGARCVQRGHRRHRRLPHRGRVARVPRPEEVRPDDESRGSAEEQHLGPSALSTRDDRLREPKGAVGDGASLRGQRRAVVEHVRDLSPQSVRRLAPDEGCERGERGSQDSAAEVHQRGSLDAESDARQPRKVQPVRHGRVGDGEEEREREDGAHRRGQRHVPPAQRRDGGEVPPHESKRNRVERRRNREARPQTQRFLARDGHGHALEAGLDAVVARGRGHHDIAAARPAQRRAPAIARG